METPNPNTHNPNVPFKSAAEIEAALTELQADYSYLLRENEAGTKTPEQIKAEIDNAFTLKETEKKLKTDNLTGLPNDLAFQEWFAKKTNPEINIPDNLGIGFIDIDKMKYLNDTYGHNKVDEVIKTIAEILSSQLRQGDDMIAARRSGDEFYIAVDHVDTNSIQIISERISREINSVCIAPDGQLSRIDPDEKLTPDMIRVSVTIGIALLEPGMSLADVTDAADEKMREAKQNGGGLVLGILPNHSKNKSDFKEAA